LIEGVVAENDAVLVLGVRGRARYAQAHVPNDEVTKVSSVLQRRLLRHEELIGNKNSFKNKRNLLKILSC
jgi:hypothetical protein